MSLIERARVNLKNSRNFRGEEIPQKQIEANLMAQQMRRQCEELLDLYGQKKIDKNAKWLVFHPWILMAALFQRVTPMTILEQKELKLVLSYAEPPVTMVLAHAGRAASKSWFITACVKGVPEELRLYKDRGSIFPVGRANQELRRANLQDIQDYKTVIRLFREQYPI